MTLTTHHLDYNELFPLDLDYDEQSRTLKVSIGLDTNPNPRLIGNLNHLMRCMTTGPDATVVSKHIEGNTVLFHPVPSRFALQFDEKPFALYTRDPQNGELLVRELRPFTDSALRTLGTQHQSKATLYRTPQTFEEFDALRLQAKETISTDFHTHSSGQISARGLIEVALQHSARYPLHLLHDVGVFPASLGDRDKQHMHIDSDGYPALPVTLRDHPQLQKTPRILFPPLEPQKLRSEVDTIALADLTNAELRTLEQHMSLRTDSQASYTDAENECYRLRYPFTKDIGLLKDSIKQMARESLRSGINYAEISFVGLDKPEIFQKVHEAIWEIEHDSELKGFTLRLKHGIPRTFTQAQIKESLEKAKVLSRSPYIVGVDFLGYEINKTTSFTNLLDEFALWVKAHDPNFSICVHAGENDKNPENVKEVLRLSLRHGVRVRIGHGLYGLDDEAIELIRSIEKKWPSSIPLVHIEANPSSNIALNNIDDLRAMPFRRMLDNNIPTLVSSDSLGLYCTSSEQLGLALIHAGLTSKDLDYIRQSQQQLETHQRDYSKRTAVQSGQWHDPYERDQFLATLTGELDKVPKAKVPTSRQRSYKELQEELGADGPIIIPEKAEVKELLKATNRPKLREELDLPATQELMALLRNKKPLTIVGASGTSWQRISPGHRREIAIAFDMLAHALNPEKVYILQGRNKAEGVCDAINTAADRADAESDVAFNKIGLLTDSTTLDSNTDYSHLTHIARIKTPLDVADALVDFTVHRGGTLVAVGGAAFTRDIILKADRRMEKSDRGVLLVMKGPEGAANDKARCMDNSYTFSEGKELIQKLFEQNKRTPEYFRPIYRQPDDKMLRDLYNQAAERVGDRYGSPDPDLQRIIDIRQPTLPGMEK